MKLRKRGRPGWWVRLRDSIPPEDLIPCKWCCKECGREVAARGLCWKHYRRVLRAEKRNT